MAIERREFLKTTGKAITVGAAALALGGKILGANDRVRVAVCGVRGRGHDHIRGFSHVPGVELAALCDVDENVLNQRLGDVEKMGLPRPNLSSTFANCSRIRASTPSPLPLPIIGTRSSPSGAVRPPKMSTSKN